MTYTKLFKSTVQGASGNNELKRRKSASCGLSAFLANGAVYGRGCAKQLENFWASIMN